MYPDRDEKEKREIIVENLSSHADFYRRHRSLDGIVLTDYEMKKVPLSCPEDFVSYEEKVL